MFDIIRKKLAELKPNDAKIVWLAFYSITITLLAFSIFGIKEPLLYWAIPRLAAAAYLFVYYAFVPKDKFPDWVIGQYWLTTLVFCLPIDILWYLWNENNLTSILALFLAHSAIILWVLPLYLSRGFLVTILLVSICHISYTDIPPLQLSNSLLLFPQLGLGLLIFGIIIEYKFKITSYVNQHLYLKNQQKLKNRKKLKSIAYNLATGSSVACSSSSKNNVMLEHVVKDVTESLAFLEKNPLYKQSFQSIVNKFPEWAIFLKRQAKSKDHMLLLPTEATLDVLMDKVAIALEREVWRLPKLVVRKQDEAIPNQVLCDVNQIIYVLVTAILRMVDLGRLETQYVKIQLHTTYLQYKKSDLLHNDRPSLMTFPAIAAVISTSTTHPAALPKVQGYYKYITTHHLPNQYDSEVILPECLDFGIKIMERIMHAHYGYLEMPNRCALLLVLPCHVAAVRDEMIAKLPMGLSEMSITPEEETESMNVLITFHKHVCKVSYANSGVIAEILLLLRRCYGFKRHPSGQLFYVRAVGIAELVATWLFYSPKLIYAALLYDLVRYTGLPLSYIKANYDLDIFYFVERVLSIDKYQVLAQPLLYANNRFKDNAVNQSKVSVLYIKLAEQLYDLRHAAGYTSPEKVQYMAKEALSVDIELARQYLEEYKIAEALTSAAECALEICKEQL